MADTADLEFDRVTYREGQRLTARDLEDERARKARLRRLHVRHLHATWGIALGYDVRAAGTGTVAVGPGYALDLAGRDLVLSAHVAIPVPSVPGPATFVLVATFLPDCAFPTSAAAGGACLDSPLHPRRERPALAWRTPAEFEPGPMVPLAHVVVHNGAIQGAVGQRVRRYARRLVRPLIATGQTDTPATWTSPWHMGGFVLLEQTVNTVDAGFTRNPVYFAELVATKSSPDQPPEETARALAQAYGHLSDMTADSFRFRIVIPGEFVRTVADWAVSWVGVEPVPGCAPSFDLTRLMTMAGTLFRFQ
jgi:hypothetical protein